MEKLREGHESSESVSENSNIGAKIMKLVKGTGLAIGLTIAGGTGILVVHDYEEAQKVDDVKDEFYDLKKELEDDVAPAAKNVKSNPHELASILQEKRLKFARFVDHVEELQKGGLKIRADLVEKMVTTVEEGRGKTWNENLEWANDINEFSSLLGEWSGASNYVPVKNQLDAMVKELNRLRKIILRMEDIDLTGVSSNFDVNLVALFKAGDLQSQEVTDKILEGIELRRKRREEYRDATDFLDFKEGKGDLPDVIWDGRYSESNLISLQSLMLNCGYLKNVSQITGKEDVATKNALKAFVRASKYQKEMLEGAFHPDKVAPYDHNAKMTQKELVYMGYLDEKYVDGKYHERTHQRLKKYFNDFTEDKKRMEEEE